MAAENTPGIFKIMDYLKEHIVPSYRNFECIKSNYRIRTLFHRLSSIEERASKYSISEIKKYFPTLLKLKSINDISVYAIQKFINFVYKQNRFPEKGELVIDGFWDLCELRNMPKINYKPQKNKVYGIYSPEMTQYLYSIFHTILRECASPKNAIIKIIYTNENKHLMNRRIVINHDKARPPIRRNKMTNSSLFNGARIGASLEKLRVTYK